MTEAETKKFLETPAAQLVSGRERSTWVARISTRQAGSARKVWALSQSILKSLLPVTSRFIAGTDSGGGYANSIRGFALHDELETFESLGMPTIQVLRSATVNAAAALGQPRSFGAIDLGMRADLLLLDRNPLESVTNLRNPRGVMVRGIWLDDSMLRQIEETLRRTYAEAAADSSLDNPSRAQIEQLVSGMESLAKEGWIFNHHQLGVLVKMLRDAGQVSEAKRVSALFPSPS
jgi:hypothetical protein